MKEGDSSAVTSSCVSVVYNVSANLLSQMLVIAQFTQYIEIDLRQMLNIIFGKYYKYCIGLKIFN